MVVIRRGGKKKKRFSTAIIKTKYDAPGPAGFPPCPSGVCAVSGERA